MSVVVQGRTPGRWDALLLDGDGVLWFLSSEVAPAGFSSSAEGLSYLLGVAQSLGLASDRVRIEVERDPDPDGGGLVMGRWEWSR